MGRRAGACFGLGALVACICTNAAVLAEELVQFESAPFRVSEIQQRLAQERGETLRAAADTIQGYLSKPEGSGSVCSYRVPPRMRWAFGKRPKSHLSTHDRLGLCVARGG